MKIAVGLGTSLGDRQHTLALALRRLDATPFVRVLRVSRAVRTPPLRGGTARGAFLNAVALVACSAEPEALLARCQALEAASGRRRASFWGDRTLDLDLLLAEGLIRTGPALTLPHPALTLRPFVLAPLLEVWPDAIDPRTGQPLAAMSIAPGPQPVALGSLNWQRHGAGLAVNMALL